MSARTLVPLLALAGCFGDGPVPSKPEQATVLMQLAAPSSRECDQKQYIGPIALGGTYGYAGVETYQPQIGCDFDGQSSPFTTEVPLWQFPKDGSAPAAAIGAAAGSSDGTYSPRLQGLANNVIWLASPGNMGGTAALQVGGTVADFMLDVPTSGGFYAPLGILWDGAYVYIAASNGSSGKAEPNNPNYPCCGPGNTGQQGALVARIDPDADPLVAESLPITPPLDCNHSTRCLLHNTDWLLYLAFAQNTSSWKIARFPKAGTMASEEEVLAQPSQVNGTIPVGFHGSDANVVWAMSRSYDQSPFPSTPRCEIMRYDLVNGVDVGPIFATDAFDCAGISLDDESVYFTIVATSDDQHMHGLGIGRVHLDTTSVETIRLGVFGATAGPRRVLIDDDALIVADPFTVARIPKSALDDRHDFE